MDFLQPIVLHAGKGKDPSPFKSLLHHNTGIRFLVLGACLNAWSKNPNASKQLIIRCFMLPWAEGVPILFVLHVVEASKHQVQISSLCLDEMTLTRGVFSSPAWITLVKCSSKNL